MTGLRQQQAIIQRQIMSAASAVGVTHLVAARVLGCSQARVDAWTQASGQRLNMQLRDILGLIEDTSTPLQILRPLLDACGLVAVERHETDAAASGSLMSQVLTLGAWVGQLQGQCVGALADDVIDQEERAALLRVIDAALASLQALRAQLVSR
jgi:hypothetical protein